LFAKTQKCAGKGERVDIIAPKCYFLCRTLQCERRGKMPKKRYLYDREGIYMIAIAYFVLILAWTAFVVAINISQNPDFIRMRQVLSLGIKYFNIIPSLIVWYVVNRWLLKRYDKSTTNYILDTNHNDKDLRLILENEGGESEQIRWYDYPKGC
jgi:hypothetical protein